MPSRTYARTGTLMTEAKEHERRPAAGTTKAARSAASGNTPHSDGDEVGWDTWLLLWPFTQYNIGFYVQ